MTITTRSGKTLPGPSVGEHVDDDVIKKDHNVAENSPAEDEKLGNDDIPLTNNMVMV